MLVMRHMRAFCHPVCKGRWDARTAKSRSVLARTLTEIRSQGGRRTEVPGEGQADAHSRKRTARGHGFPFVGDITCTMDPRVPMHRLGHAAV